MAPSITSFSPDSATVGDGITKNNSITLTGTATSNTTVRVYDGTTLLGSATTNSSGAWNFKTITLSDGAHSFTAVTTVASSGTTSGFPGASTTGVPAGTALTASSGDFTTSYDGQVIDALNVRGTIFINNSNVIIKNSQAQYIIVNADHATVQNCDITGNDNFTKRDGIFIGADNTTVLYCDISGAENGIWLEGSNFSIKDNYIHNLPYDSQRDPHIDGLQVPEGAGVSNGEITHNNFDLGSDHVTSSLMLSDFHDSLISNNRFNGGGYTVYFEDGSEGNKVTNNTFVNSGGWGEIYPGDSAATAQTYSGNVTGAGASILGGSATSATATPSTTTETSAPMLVKVDTVAPSAPKIAASTSATDLAKTHVEALTGTAEAKSTVTIYDGTTKVGTAIANASGAWTYTTALLSAGSHSFTATATDVAGNTGVASSAAVVTIAAGPSTPTIASFSTDSGVAGDRVTNDNSLTLTGAAPANSTVKVFDGSTLIATATASSSGVWSLTTNALANGSHSLTATATNSGATSAASTPLSVMIDTVAPAAPKIVASTSAVDLAKTHVEALTGTAEAKSTVTIFDGTTKVGTATANASGAWTYTTAPLSLGSHNFTATATDVAGNTGVASSATVVTVAAASGGINFTDLTQSRLGVTKIQGKADPGDVIALYDGSKPLGSVTARDDGSWTFKKLGLSDSVHIITAEEVNGSGQVVSKSTGAAILGSKRGDTLTGTAGNDVFLGKDGEDTFAFAQNFGADVIRDFDADGRRHDVIQFNKSVFDSFASVLAHASQVGMDVVISAGSDTLTLKNTKLSVLDSQDFHFA